MNRIEQELLFYFEDKTVKSLKSPAVLIACSGGPDSVCLAAAARRITDRVPRRFILAHVNHRLRGMDSSLDERFVRDLAQSAGWPFLSRTAHVSQASSGNLEERARVRRYGALAQMARKVKAQLILTAHTQDDHIETIIMNVGRGAGPDGLVGMVKNRFLVDGIILGRPLLDISKNDILDYLKRNGQSYRQDQTNHNDAFLRNWIRSRFLPLWEAKVPAVKKRLAALSSIMQEENHYWNKETTKASKSLVNPWKDGKLIDIKRFSRRPLALQRRLLRRIVGKDLLTFDASERLRRWMLSSPSGRRTFQLKKGWKVERLSRSQGSPSSKHFWFHTTYKGKK